MQDLRESGQTADVHPHCEMVKNGPNSIASPHRNSVTRLRMRIVSELLDFLPQRVAQIEWSFQV